MLQFDQLKKRQWLLFQAGLVLAYLATHLLSLTKLPVFADESIYIRWSQLIIDDWQRYLFFPLNDGKTPLQMWLMVPFLQLIKDQLLAARLLSLVFGLGQLLLVKKIIEKLGGSRFAQFGGMVYVIFLPFWFFHHRMALIDAQLTFFLSFVTLGLFELTDDIQKNAQSKRFLLSFRGFKWLIWTGLAFTGAFYTKLPAVFFAPVFILFSVRYLRWPLQKSQIRGLLSSVFWVGLAGLIGILGFLTLRVSPAFGQLFARGEDFTFSMREILTVERHTPFNNLVRVTGWFLSYLSPVLVFTPLLSLGKVRNKRSLILLCATSAVFALPFIVIGKVLAPRYFLPSAFGLTIASVLLFDQWRSRFKKKQLWLFYILIVSPIIWSVPFLWTSWFDVWHIPFVKTDQEQYQTEWSAGFGNREVTQLILEQAQHGRIVVATEGTFGTLPDGILMDLHNVSVQNVEVYGIGQPITTIPLDFVEKARVARTAWIVVNSHRMKTQDERLTKIYSFPRPRNGPTLDVYEFKQ